MFVHTYWLFENNKNAAIIITIDFGSWNSLVFHHDLDFLWMDRHYNTYNQ